MTRCTAKIRPFPNSTELRCESDEQVHGVEHRCVLRDYAYPGSETVFSWLENDRRNFRGKFIRCTQCAGCVLPYRHRGDCAL